MPDRALLLQYSEILTLIDNSAEGLSYFWYNFIRQVGLLLDFEYFRAPKIDALPGRKYSKFDNFNLKALLKILSGNSSLN